MNPPTINQIQKSAEFSNFCQRVKMAYQKRLPRLNRFVISIVSESDLDEILLIAWQELKK